MARSDWMQPEKIRQLYGLGWSNAAIAQANEEATGWRPSTGAVSRKLAAMGFPPRRANHRELIPWRINPKHAHSQIYYALQAISRQRQGIPLDRRDKSRPKWLQDLLTRRGEARVITYDYENGWELVPAQPTDTDIIRHPEPRS